MTRWIGALLMACSLGAGCNEGVCSNTCEYAHNGRCDDGRAGAAASRCAPGTDCSDCGPLVTQVTGGATLYDGGGTDWESEAEDGFDYDEIVLDISCDTSACGTCVFECSDDQRSIRICRAAGEACYSYAHYSCNGPQTRHTRTCRDGPDGYGCYFDENTADEPWFPLCNERGECADGRSIWECALFPRQMKGCGARWRLEDVGVYMEVRGAGGGARQDCGNGLHPCDFTEEDAEALCEAGSPDAGTTPPPSGICSDWVSCGGSCEYRSCSGSSGTAWLETSNGARVDCSAVGDCNSALQRALEECCL